MTKMKKTTWFIGGSALALLAVLATVFLSGGEPALAGGADVYKSPSCGCCGIWSQYADRAGLDIAVHDIPDVDRVKEEYGVPAQLWSCHTTIIGDYFVEGHVPQEAIEKLLAEKPDIKGIALPGMPSGTPGMPGPKQGPWVIYAVGHDGSISEFMTV